MAHYVVFVLHLPEMTVGQSVQQDTTILNWSEFDKTVQSSGLPIEVLKTPPQGSQRLARNLWLFALAESAQLIAAAQRIAQAYRVDYSAFMFSGDVSPMTK